MDDLGDLARDLGFLPQRGSPPMAAFRPNPAAVPSPNPNNTAAAPLFHKHKDAGFSDDVFGGPLRPTNATRQPPPSCDKPVYDDDDFDIFDGVAGVETAFSAKYDGASSSSPGPAPSNRTSSSPYEDLLGSFAVEEPAVRVDFSVKSQPSNGYSALDDLLPGFGGTTVESKSSDTEENNNVVPPSTVSSTQSKSSFLEDPFVFLESVPSSTYRSPESSEDMNNPCTSDYRKVDNSSPNGEIFDEVDGFDGFVNIKLKSPNGGGSVDSSYASRESTKASCRNIESGSTLFDVPTSVPDSHVSANDSRPPNMGPDFMETNTDIGLSSRSDGNNENLDEIWLSVSEIPLFTQLTISPPPARPPPKPLVSITDMNGKKKSHDSVKNAPHSAIDELEEFAIDMHPQPPGYGCSNIRFGDGKKKVKNPPSSAIDELEEFSIGGHPRSPIDGWPNIPFSEEDSEANFTASAMKQAMDKVETKFKHAKEVRERENDDKAANNRDSAQMNEDDKTSHGVPERENRDSQEQLEREQREKEEKEKERKRVEKEKEEGEKARRAVEMVTREARERAAIEARLRAERAAVEKATNEARLRAERAAVQKAAAEARERAATVARERAAAVARERAAAVAREKASAETRERAAAEARERAEKAAAEARERQVRERAAVERAAAEVRLRAQAEARDRAAAAARERQQKSESCFGMSARPTSAPRQRAASDLFDSQFQTKSTDAARAVGTSSNMRKASSTANIIDDLTSVFGAVASSTEFQEIDGESEERRKARYERHMRTRERAAKALAEKNERDILTQKEQEERHRIAERLDIEIKRWASGKEGNLRAMLSTLQCVLWPESGWQPVSLVDLITAASVKKVYRKATLCIHPDKVQQKGATLQQKYIAEKVFDLLKEAWNKFNSEELF